MHQIKFPSIEQFKHAIKQIRSTAEFSHIDENGIAVKELNPIYPKLTFKGTIKIHGTNGCVAQEEATGPIYTFSRNRKLTLTSDNMGFAFFIQRENDLWNNFFFTLRKLFNLHDKTTICVYGELAGENIQKNVAISNLPKSFFIFQILFVDHLSNKESWFDDFKALNLKDMLPQNVYFIDQFPTYEIEIDFDMPGASQNKLVELTNAVEECCPVAAAFGHKGIGEGIVWALKTSSLPSEHKRFAQKTWFKVKGEKHSVSNVTTLAEIDDTKLTSSRDFINRVITEARLEQIWQKLAELNIEQSIKSTGTFLKMFSEDVLKEELDTLIASGLEPKDVNKELSTQARQWFMRKLSK